MKKSLFVLLLVLFLGVFGAPSVALAGEMYHSSGQNAYAYFSAIDPSSSGCTWVEAAVGPNSGKYQTPPGRGTSGTDAWVFVHMYDYCTYAEKAGWGSAQLSDQAFKVGSTFARLTATIMVEDLIYGGSFPVTIDLTWAGAKPAMRQSDHEHIHSQGFSLNYRWTGMYQLADATGTISDGTTNYTPEASIDGNFGTGRTMLVRVE